MKIEIFFGSFSNFWLGFGMVWYGLVWIGMVGRLLGSRDHRLNPSPSTWTGLD